MKWWGCTLSVAMVLAGCRTRPFEIDGGEAIDAAVDLTRAVDARGVGDFSVVDLAVVDLSRIDQAPVVCSATLVGGSVKKSNLSCILIESVSSRQGVLRYPCAGGAAEATFGADKFTGTVVAGVVDLAFHTPFPWSDGCKWETHQWIRGMLGEGKLVFDYEENPLQGEMGCTFPCVGTADVFVK